MRTSIFPSRWRYKWATLNALAFDHKCVTLCNERTIVENSIVNFITRFLFLHARPIHKFSLSTMYWQSSYDIEQWLLFLSRKDIKELVLELGESEWFGVPSFLFSFKKLIRLELVRCELDPSPYCNGFLCLKYLNLQQVQIPPDDIECHIASCPLLESLTLSYFDGLGSTVFAPNLKYLALEGEFKDVL
ncbi:Hypothetical predicted protein [Olea europaea subsp. europaea]|uniref:F-box/LRR-repeat protein 15/At3g58940/PEG3-like LRR domain-containing protein n=1 Tax=Olea europaea subsp. europaea TaxID=158383 RepID=A0A8S0REJ9_OLEEU|nr:Hypothetical predicted protein [Olea europaea subsp. europaea]